jgi:hypothetical protein
VRVGREFQAAVALRDDHREEALRLDVLPHFRRQVAAPVRDVEIVEHAAQRLARAVEKRLLLGRQARAGRRMQLAPVGIAGEQLAFPPHRAGLERVALGIGHRGQQAAVGAHERPADQRDAQRPHIQQPEARQQQPQQALPQAVRIGEHAIGDQQYREGDGEGEQGQAPVREIQHRDDEKHGDDGANHAVAPGAISPVR